MKWNNKRKKILLFLFLNFETKSKSNEKIELNEENKEQLEIGK